MSNFRGFSSQRGPVDSSVRRHRQVRVQHHNPPDLRQPALRSFIAQRPVDRRVGRHGEATEGLLANHRGVTDEG